MLRIIPIALNQLVGFMIGLAGVRLISSMVPPTVYGRYSIFLTLTQIGYLLTHSGLVNHAARYWDRESSYVRHYAHFLWQAGWKRTFILAWILLLLTSLRAGFEARSDWLLVMPLLLCSNLALALASIATSALNAGERHWVMLWFGAITASARAFLPVLLVYLFGAQLIWLGLGFAIHGLVIIVALTAVLQFFWKLDLLETTQTERWTQEMGSYGRPFMLLGVGSWCLLSTDRWLVFHFFHEDFAGIFSMAFAIAAILPNMLYAGLMQSVFPKAFRDADSATVTEDWRKLARRCDWMTVAFVTSSCGVLTCVQLLAPFILGWIVNIRYAPSMGLILPAGLAAISLQVNQFYFLLLQGKHNSSAMVQVMFAVAGIKIVGGIVAALISIRAFEIWLVLGMFVCWGVGRTMVRFLVFRQSYIGSGRTI